jgi:hypothetical protein
VDERSDEEDSLEGVCGERFPCCGVDGRHVGMSCFQSGCMLVVICF